MKSLDKYTIEELQKELDKRESDLWPKYVTIGVDIVDIMTDEGWDDIENQLGYNIYSDEIKERKISDLFLPLVNLTFAINEDGHAGVIAVDRMEISDKEFSLDLKENAE